MTAAEQGRAGEDAIVGQVVQGRFRVLSRLAAGGMGVVYKSEQIPLGRVIALKILESKHNAQIDENFSKRFFLEASAAAKLAHPNTIVVHDYGRTEEGLYFIAMEFLDGGCLGTRLKKHGPLTPSQAIHVGMQVCGSLRDAHQQGLVHRDLKPGNVMFAPRGGDPFFVKVLDFGLVKVLGQDDANLGLTQSGVMMGSPRYMAPEQVKAQQVDHRADIYSFGAMLYHMLAGAPPFAAGSAFEAMHAHVNLQPPPLRATWPGCTAGPQLEHVVMRCLAKMPADRPGSMDEVMYALRSCEAEAGAMSAGGGYSGYQSLQQPYPQGPTGPYAAQGTDSNPSMTPSGMQSISVSMGPSGVRIPQTSAIPVMSAQHSGIVSNKTVMFDAGPSAPPPAEPMAMPAPEQSGGSIVGKLLFALFLIAGLGIGAAAVVFFVPGLLPRNEMHATPIRVEAPVAEPAPPPVVAAPAAAPAAEASAVVVEEPAPVPEQAPAEGPSLVVHSDPPGATVRRHGADLGDTPVSLLIPRGERWVLQVSKEGYEPREITVAGGQPELTIHLEPQQQRGRNGRPIRQMAPTIAPAPTLNPAPRPLTPVGPSRPRGNYSPDLNDPWAR